MKTQCVGGPMDGDYVDVQDPEICFAIDGETGTDGADDILKCDRFALYELIGGVYKYIRTASVHEIDELRVEQDTTEDPADRDN